MACSNDPFHDRVFTKRLRKPPKNFGPLVKVKTTVVLHKNLKPVFHCDAKTFALGPHVGLDPHGMLGIPTCWYLKTLKFALPPSRIKKFALPPTQNINRSQCRLRWVPNAKFSRWPCTCCLCWFYSRWGVCSRIWALEHFILFTANIKKYNLSCHKAAFPCVRHAMSVFCHPSFVPVGIS